MKKFSRMIAFLLALVIALSVFAPMVYAEEGDVTVPDGGESEENTGGEKLPVNGDLNKIIERLRVLNTQGYDFPPEGDLEIPKYKLVYEDGTEEIRYNAGMMASDFENAPSGTTLVLLSSLYQSTTYVNAAKNSGISYLMQAHVSGEKVINFDFAGHTIFNEYKNSFFSAEYGAEINVYSSAPGAKLVCLYEGSTSGGSVADVTSTMVLPKSVINLGDYGEYPGSNLSTYSPGGLTIKVNSVINVNGISMYRVGTDHVAYFNISSHDSEMNFNRARIFGVGRYLQIACREDTSNGTNIVYNNVINFNDCVISNIGSAQVLTGIFFRYMSDDNEIHFKGTVLDYVNFECQKYYTHTGAKANDLAGNPLPAQNAIITMDKYCSYNQLPDVRSIQKLAETSNKYAMFQFPELDPGFGYTGSGTPEYILANGLCTDVDTFVMNDSDLQQNGYYDYTIFDLTDEGEDISGMYAFPYLGYENDVREVTWSFRGSSSAETELWIKGETPVPYRLNIPKDNEYVKYVIECFHEDDTMAYYSVNPEVNITLKCNFEFKDKAKINVYIPEFKKLNMDELIFRMTVAGTTLKVATMLEEGVPVTIDGANYTKVTVEVPYDRLSDDIFINVDIANASGVGVAFSATGKVELDALLESYLDSDELDDEFKGQIEDVLYIIYKKASPSKIMGISNIVKTRLADRLEADKQSNKNESAGFIDKILDMFK